MFLKNYLNTLHPDKVYLIHQTRNNVYLVKKTYFSRFYKNSLKALVTFYSKRYSFFFDKLVLVF